VPTRLVDRLRFWPRFHPGLLVAQLLQLRQGFAYRRCRRQRVDTRDNRARRQPIAFVPWQPQQPATDRRGHDKALSHARFRLDVHRFSVELATPSL
jgi:hypothetical protein